MPKSTKSTSGLSAGSRLYDLRKATGLSREEFQARHGIRAPSLRGWESGLRTLKRHKVELFIPIFKHYGINCTIDWILYGEGPDPLEVRAQSTDESYILQEIARFESFYPNSTVIEVADNCMAPWIREGDYVGGIFKDEGEHQDCFLDQVCLVKTKEFGTQIRLVQKAKEGKLYNLRSCSHAGEIMNVELQAVAVIIFLRRRQELVEGKAYNKLLSTK